MGVPARVIRRNRPKLAQMIGYLDGRVYYAIDNWYQLHGMIRCFRPLFPSARNVHLGNYRLSELRVKRRLGAREEGPNCGHYLS